MLQRIPSRKWKGSFNDEEKYLQIIYPVKDLYLENIKNSSNSKKKKKRKTQKTQLQMGKVFEWTFFSNVLFLKNKKDIKMANKYME